MTAHSLFSKKHLLGFSVGFACIGASLWQAASEARPIEDGKTASFYRHPASALVPAQTAAVAAQQVDSRAKAVRRLGAPSGKQEKPSYAVSSTTGWRNIDGWEQDVVERDPNLKNWSWLGMQEMNKGYIRLRPGEVGVKRPRRYAQTVHVQSVVKPARVVRLAPMNTERRYLQPNHIPLPSRASVAARAKMNRPSTQISLAAPRTRIALGLPKTGIGLSAPRTTVRFGGPSTRLGLAAPGTQLRLSAPATNVQLAAPSTNARLSVPSTEIRLAAPSTSVQLVASQARARLSRPVQPADAMADVGRAFSPDQFESPGTEIRDPYGSPWAYSSMRTAATVRGRVTKRSPW